MIYSGIDYKIIGNGIPIILIHGNNENHSVFRKFINKFNEYKLILVDSRNHGLSFSGKVSYDIIKRDIIDLLNHLKIIDPIIIGFSDGANVGILLNIERKFSKSILIGGNTNFKGLKFFTRIRIHVAYFFCLNRRKKRNIKIMLEHQRFKLDKIAGDILLIYGKKDCVKKRHIKEISEKINNSQLEIINGNHYLLESDECIDKIKLFIR